MPSKQKSSFSSILSKSWFLGFLASECWFLLLFLLDVDCARSQSVAPANPPVPQQSQPINPVTPPVPERPQPRPIPPSQKPVEIPPTAPPTPEEVLDIPGTITVRQFEFVGNTAFSQAELNQVVTEFVGKPVTFAQLIQAANKVTEIYVQRGYITSGAYIPRQEIEAGIVKIQILEGSLEEIEVKIAEGRLNPDYVRSRIAVATKKPLNVNRLQEALQLLQGDPLIDSLSAELSAGTRAGTNTLSVTVTGADTFKVTLELNNNRNPSIGSFQRGIEISEANLFGIGDGIRFAYYNTDGSDRFEGGYTIPVNPYNGTVSFNFAIADNKIVEPPFDRLNIEVDSLDFDLTYRQPVFRKATAEASQELALSFTAARRESESKLLGVRYPVFVGADEEGKTRVSALRFAQEWTQRSRQEVFSARSQFSVGLDLFDATVNDREPDSRFFAWRGQLLYLRLLGEATGDPAVGPTLLLRSDIQLAASSLLPFEQFGYGGQATVRGYRQDVLLTDNGIVASAEARLPIARFPGVRGVLQLAPFIDFGTGWNAEGNNPSTNTLVGIGLGLLLDLGDNFRARLDWGIPLVDIDSGDRTWQENGVYFQLEYNLF
ncbi:hemolysin activation/secretion protein [Pleurocapsa sp. PCC 7327]|uniref:ShlB/FhaC/HecB family hemolysin secretion/activation protein n=1 Tax=Pleurocapsa sp. PCC 7327 TaxID=118163 RepID=UPI00029FD39F|nr:ShlB/FhaC/HecB family hemolysin secretion/activation protein [Pleurocapsa sp. PCC 7327]AFY76971.1 hemolysin activation/secretion protein [Pleurocapsa sp. PCC 7327]